MTQSGENLGPLPLGYAAPSPADSRWGKGFLAVCGTFIFWGVGHWIAGFRRRAVCWAAALVLVNAVLFFVFITPSLFLVLLFVVPLAIATYLAALTDAFVCGRRAARPMLGRPSLRYLAGVGLLCAAWTIGRKTSTFYKSALRRAGAETYAITTVSMRPTLLPGDRLLTHRPAALGRWDLVVFHPPQRGDVWTRRIVGLPGEHVEIVGGQVRINGATVAAPASLGRYVGSPLGGVCTGCEGDPIRLGPGEYFLMGDNSTASYDSRWWREIYPGHQLGAVPRSAILGKVTGIYFPPRRIHQFK